MKKHIIVLCLLWGFPLMGLGEAKNFEIQKGLPITRAHTTALLTNTLASGDATIVVSNNTDLAYIRPVGSATSSLKWDVTVAGTGTTLWNFDWVVEMPLTGVKTLHLPVFVDIPSGVFTNWDINMYLSQTSTFADRYNYKWFTLLQNNVRNGWNLMTVDIGTPASTTGSPNRANPFQRIRFQIQVPVGATGTLYIGNLFANYINKPQVVFTFDDVSPGQYTEGFDYLTRKGFVGSMALISPFVNLTTAQVQDMYAKGWSMHNHTASHVDLTTLTQAQVVTEMNTEFVDMASKGLLYGWNAAIYPFGTTNATVEAGLAQVGITHGLITGNIPESMWDGFSQPYRINRQNTDVPVTLATLQTVIDNLIKYGGTTIFLTHSILVGAPSAQTELATFRGIVDYVKRYADRGELEVRSLQSLIDGMEGDQDRITQRRRMFIH